MKERPVIGISAWTRPLRAGRRERPAETLPRGYVEAVAEAGGLPVVLPNADDPKDARAYLRLVDGLLLSGGDDPHPRHFGEEPHPRIETVDERRDAFEMELCRAARELRVPLFGICRGVQILNIAFGGDIYQDIASQADSPLGHVQNTVADGVWHDVEIRPESRLSAILHGGPALRVNSFHHQACRRPAPGLRIAATAADGLIEALEDPNHPFLLGVQWHPELIDGGGHDALFLAFLEAAREHARASSKVGPGSSSNDGT